MVLQAKVERRGQEYRVSIHQEQGDGLRIEVEQESDGSLWRGQFSPSSLSPFISLASIICIQCAVRSSGGCFSEASTLADIEDITAKAGNLKKAAVFNKMLQSALTGKSAAVHVDVLSFSGKSFCIDSSPKTCTIICSPGIEHSCLRGVERDESDPSDADSTVSCLRPAEPPG